MRTRARRRRRMCRKRKRDVHRGYRMTKFKRQFLAAFCAGTMAIMNACRCCRAVVIAHSACAVCNALLLLLLHANIANEFRLSGRSALDFLPFPRISPRLWMKMNTDNRLLQRQSAL